VGKILQITVVGIIAGGMHKWRARHRMWFLLASHRGFEAYDDIPHSSQDKPGCDASCASAVGATFMRTKPCIYT